ncbi:hypothetical protein EJB05_23442, partial [Eragrostis curvula]
MAVEQIMGVGEIEDSGHDVFVSLLCSRCFAAATVFAVISSAAATVFSAAATVFAVIFLQP